MIKENSLSSTELGFIQDYYELVPRGRYKKEHDNSFKEIREVILNSLTKNYDEEDLVKMDSFIVYVIPRKEENFLRDLERAGRLDKRKYYTLFTIKDLDRFLSDILAQVINDDSFPDAPPITEKQRNIIINDGDGEEEKNELNGDNEQYGKEFLEKIAQLGEEINKLKSQKEEEEKLLEKAIEQENVQEIERLEKEINQLKKTIKQKEQELENLKRKQAAYVKEVSTN
ncbi:16845_t:CDS:2 [Funneliformis geosporum]|nr:16845_t:CDS:2 [Funneliformis geosporum]